MAYTGGFYGNMSNYHSFGGMKFAPRMDKSTFAQILNSHPSFFEEGNELAKLMSEVYPKIETEIFALDKPYTQLNFPHEGGVTAYFGRNMTAKDLEDV